MSFFLNFIKYVSLAGVFYFAVLSALLYIKFEPLKLKNSEYFETFKSGLIAIGVSYIHIQILIYLS